MVVLIFLLLSVNVYADNRPSIYSLIDKEIFIKNNWAGETITLKEKNNELFIIRKILRSGVTGGPKYKYSTQLKSKYQIRFSTM